MGTLGGATTLGRDAHDGATAYRDFVFDERCGQEDAPCFKYVSPPKAIPRP